MNAPTPPPTPDTSALAAPRSPAAPGSSTSANAWGAAAAVSPRRLLYGVATVESALGAAIALVWVAVLVTNLTNSRGLLVGGVALMLILHAIAVVAGHSRFALVATVAVLAASLTAASATFGAASPRLESVAYLVASVSVVAYNQALHYGTARRRSAQPHPQLAGAVLFSFLLLTVGSGLLAAVYLYSQSLDRGAWYWFVLAAVAIAAIGLWLALAPAAGAPKDSARIPWLPGTRLSAPDITDRPGFAGDESAPEGTPPPVHDGSGLEPPDGNPSPAHDGNPSPAHDGNPGQAEGNRPPDQDGRSRPDRPAGTP